LIESYRIIHYCTGQNYHPLKDCDTCKSRGSWVQRLDSSNRSHPIIAVTTTRHVRAMDIDLDLSLC